MNYIKEHSNLINVNGNLIKVSGLITISIITIIIVYIYFKENKKIFIGSIFIISIISIIIIRYIYIKYNPIATSQPPDYTQSLVSTQSPESSSLLDYVPPKTTSIPSIIETFTISGYAGWGDGCDGSISIFLLTNNNNLLDSKIINMYSKKNNIAILYLRLKNKFTGRIIIKRFDNLSNTSYICSDIRVSDLNILDGNDIDKFPKMRINNKSIDNYITDINDLKPILDIKTTQDSLIESASILSFKDNLSEGCEGKLKIILDNNEFKEIDFFSKNNATPIIRLVFKNNYTGKLIIGRKNLNSNNYYIVQDLQLVDVKEIPNDTLKTLTCGSSNYNIINKNTYFPVVSKTTVMPNITSDNTFNTCSTTCNNNKDCSGFTSWGPLRQTESPTSTKQVNIEGTQYCSFYNIPNIEDKNFTTQNYYIKTDYLPIT